MRYMKRSARATYRAASCSISCLVGLRGGPGAKGSGVHPPSTIFIGLPNPSPGVQPGAKGPQGSVIRGHGAPSEADSSHARDGRVGRAPLLDHLVRPLQQGVRNRKPERLAVLRLITNSNLVACSTGRSDGFAPRRIWSMRYAARRYISARSGPRQGAVGPVVGDKLFKVCD